MPYFRLIYRILFSVLYTVYIVGLVLVRRRLFGTDAKDALEIRRRWARTLMYGVGVRWKTKGVAPDYPCLLVANHRTYLDPILILCDTKALPLSMAEVSKWPLIGKGAQIVGGILYVQRDRLNSRAAMLQAIENAIVQEQKTVLVFPEGTTSDVPTTLPFKPGTFLMAARQGIPVVPVAIEYTRPDIYWVGPVSFGSHAWRQFGVKRIYATLSYGLPMLHEEGEQLRTHAESWIRGVLEKNEILIQN